MRILLVEDDLILGEGVKKAIERQGYSVDWLTDGNQAIDAICHEAFNLVVLDLGLPGRDGIDVIHRARSRGVVTPILVLTARDTLSSRVDGLDAGADDYLIKPFELEELKARIRALTRRNHGQIDSILDCGRLKLNISTMAVFLDEQEIKLSRREYGLLHEFACHAGRVLDRDHLETVLYGWDSELESNALEVHIHHLRKKLYPELIRTVRGIGYRFEKP